MGKVISLPSRYAKHTEEVPINPNAEVAIITYASERTVGNEEESLLGVVLSPALAKRFEASQFRIIAEFCPDCSLEQLGVCCCLQEKQLSFYAKVVTTGMKSLEEIVKKFAELLRSVLGNIEVIICSEFRSCADVRQAVGIHIA